MAKRAKKDDSERKKKKVSIKSLDRKPEKKGDPQPHAYRILDFLLEEKHSDLIKAEARIAIAYQMSAIREDMDGTMGFGKVKLGSDLDRAYADYDFVFIIPHELWQHSDEYRRHAIIDYHLCACAIRKGPSGEDQVDDEDRTVFRVRKPIKVFPENVGRYGLWQSESVLDAVKRYNDSRRPLLPDDRPRAHSFSEGAPKSPSETSTTTPDGIAANDPDAEVDKVNGKAHTNGHGGAWKAIRVELLGDVPAPLLKSLHSAGLPTLGMIAQFEESNGREAFNDLKGMGEGRANMLRELMADHRNANPKLYPELAAAN